MRSLFTSVFIFIILGPSLASSPIDSLSNLLKTSTGNDLAILYSQVAYAYRHKNIDSAFHYAHKGLEFARKENLDYGIAENAAVLGDLHIIHDDLTQAKEFYSLAIVYFEKASRLFDYVQTSMVIANIYLAQDKYFETYQLYQECLIVARENEFNEIIAHINNNLGVLYLRMGDYEEAYAYFDRALKNFRNLNDRYNIALAESNLAEIHYVKEEYEAALNYNLSVAPIFLELKSWTDLSHTYTNIASIHSSQNEYDKAREYLDLAINIIDNYSSTYEGPASIYKSSVYYGLGNLYFHDKEYEKAVNHAQMSLQLSIANSFQDQIFDAARLTSDIFEAMGESDSALKYYRIFINSWDSLKLEQNIKEVTQLKMVHEFEADMKEKELESLRNEAIHQQKENLYIVLIVFAILLAAILILLFLNQRNKTSRVILTKLNLELEKKQLDNVLDYKNKELTTNMMYLLEKNEFIISIAKKLVDIKTELKGGDRMIVQQIINELKNNTSKNTWDEFELRFMEVNETFYQSLNERYPDLTPNERKLCAFLRLNMSTKEISTITHQSLNTINVARSRLRKKLNIEQEENLIAHLAQL